jgi:hypothetical protein
LHNPSTPPYSSMEIESNETVKRFDSQAERATRLPVQTSPVFYPVQVFQFIMIGSTGPVKPIPRGVHKRSHNSAADIPNAGDRP